MYVNKSWANIISFSGNLELKACRAHFNRFFLAACKNHRDSCQYYIYILLHNSKELIIQLDVIQPQDVSCMDIYRTFAVVIA